MKALLTVWLVSLVLLSPAFLYAQSLREFFSNRTELNRDDLPDSTDGREELSFDEVICKDKELFPKKLYSKNYKTFVECKYNLDRIQEASYIDLTFRIRWDNDRLDLYRTNSREIFICDKENECLRTQREERSRLVDDC